jgi:phosphatidate cytidylyltransferase
MPFGLLQNVAPAVQTILTLVLGILVFFTVLFNIWKLVKDNSFVRLMLTRTYSWWAIFLTYILFFCIYPPVGHAGLCLLSLLCFREIIKHSSSLNTPKKLLWVCYAVIVAQFVATSGTQEVASLAIIPLLGMVLITIYCILFESIETTVKYPPFLVWTMILTSSGFAHLSYLYSFQSHSTSLEVQGLLVYFLFLTQFNDVLQFIWGTAFGRHYISPQISPKKTWEGLIGAVFTTMIISYGLRYITPFNEVQSLIVGFLIPIFGFWGDLTISTLKRSLKVKDMGTVIPGHGGILDRVDSVLISSLIYFYMVYFWIIKSA